MVNSLSAPYVDAGFVPRTRKTRSDTLREEKDLDSTLILQSRIVIKPTSFAHSVDFYDNALGLVRAREWGHPPLCGIVYFAGGGFIELVGGSAGEVVTGCALWLQVPNLDVTRRRLDFAEVALIEQPELKPWGFVQMAISDPDGLRIVFVEIPPDHPLRRDARRLEIECLFSD